MSKRLLWFILNGLFFECQTELPRTDCQEKINIERAEPELRSYLQLKATFHFSNAAIINFWYRAIKVYSACHLTKPDQDRILAVSGLAKEVGPILANPRQKDEISAEVQNEMYLSGLWLRDIHHGLLWEEDHSAQPWTTKVSESPTWSWASLMTLVKWPEWGQGTQEALEITGVCLSLHDRHIRPQHSVVGKRAVLPLSDSTSDNNDDELERALFDPTNFFSCLYIRGKLATVHVRGFLETKENLYTAAFSTAYGSVPTSYQWRVICSPTRPEKIAGWGL
jgi:hypothetical protein